MTHVSGVYSQLLQLILRGQLAQVVNRHQAEFKGFLLERMADIL
jgi:hypothetical protein